MNFSALGLSWPITKAEPPTFAIAHAIKLFETMSPVELSGLEATCLFHASLMTNEYGVSVSVLGGDPDGSSGVSPLREHPRHLVVGAKLEEPSLELAFKYVTEYVTRAYGPGHTPTIVSMIEHLKETDDREIARELLPSIELTISIDADGFNYTIEVE